jgi:hypothetical protein
MPKSKHRKNHKQKVSARNQRIQNEKRSIEKKQRDFIMQLIEQEKSRGLFDSNNQLTPDFKLPDSINNESPLMSGPII